MYHRLSIVLPHVLALSFAACSVSSSSRQETAWFSLSPATLGASIAIEQHLTVERDGRLDELDVALEIDEMRFDLVAMAFGQRVLTVSYNGHELKHWRHYMLPSEVRAEDVLQDIQLTLWPIAAIRSALPPTWQIEDDGLQRRLLIDGDLVTTIKYESLPRWSGTVILDNLRYRYRLVIETAATEPE